MSNDGVEIIACTSPTELYCHYSQQSEPQPAYLELDLRERVLLADYDSQVGGAVPFSVFHGFDRRYPVPVLTGDAANRVMEEIAPLAARILSDWEEVWDGNNQVARLGEDARAAEEEIERRLGRHRSGSHFSHHFAPEDLVEAWEVDGAVNGLEADEFGITAETDDDRLAEIAAKITQDLVDCGSSGAVVVPGLVQYLKDVREQQVADEA